MTDNDDIRLNRSRQTAVALFQHWLRSDGEDFYALAKDPDTDLAVVTQHLCFFLDIAIRGADNDPAAFVQQLQQMVLAIEGNAEEYSRDPGAFIEAWGDAHGIETKPPHER